MATKRMGRPPLGIEKEPLTIRMATTTATALRVAAARRAKPPRTIGAVIDDLVARYLPAVEPDAPAPKPRKRA